jgi:hypothetical protein
MVQLFSFRSLALVGTLVLGSMAPAQAYSVFTDRTAWQNAVDAISGSVTTTDTFSNPIAKAQSIILDSGITSTNSVPPSPPELNHNSVVDFGTGNYFYINATVTNNVNASATITWNFPTPVFAFGADFLNANMNALNVSGNFDGTGNQTILVDNTIGGVDGFLGIVGLANFNPIIFGNSANNEIDTFFIDNASFATQSATPATPEPNAMVALVLLGGGFFLNRNRKQG